MLTADKKDRITGEPSGEPETLWGKIQPGAFGDRVHRSKPAELEDRMKKAKERARDKRKGGMDQDDLDAYAAKRKKAAVGASVLTADADGSYRPKTRETRSAYEALLGMIQGSFGDQPQDVLRGAAEEVQLRALHVKVAKGEAAVAQSLGALWALPVSPQFHWRAPPRINQLLNALCHIH